MRTGSLVRTCIFVTAFSLFIPAFAQGPGIRISPSSLTISNAKALPADATATSTKLKPRAKAIKPKHTILTPGDQSNVITVTFADGQKIRERDGKLTDFGSKALAPAADVLPRLGGTWERVDSISEEQLDEMREKAQQNLGRELPDFNLQFILQLP